VELLNSSSICQKLNSSFRIYFVKKKDFANNYRKRAQKLFVDKWLHRQDKIDGLKYITSRLLI
jgi:hypothetical protein